MPGLIKILKTVGRARRKKLLDSGQTKKLLDKAFKTEKSVESRARRKRNARLRERARTASQPEDAIRDLREADKFSK